MRAAHALDDARAAGRLRREPPRQLLGLAARLRAPRIDRELASGAAPWSSPRHAARSLQLTGRRSRGSLARALELLADASERPPAPHLCAAIPTCRDQVRDALPLIMAVSARLRSAEPIDARGVARLRALLSDGGGPCYRVSRTDALTDALRAVSSCLDVTG
jgi:hypothetical protein